MTDTPGVRINQAQRGLTLPLRSVVCGDWPYCDICKSWVKNFKCKCEHTQPIHLQKVKDLPDSPGVRIDQAHANLLFGLVCAHKPASVLEFGFGGGRSADAILSACADNQIAADYLLVDNWRDWNDEQPEEAREFFERNAGRIRCLSVAEQVFVEADHFQTWELIFSDADHLHAHEWFQRTYDVLLAPGGILIYHDVRAFPGLAEIVSECEARGLRHVVFDRCSKRGEACQRGLLVVFKPA